MTSMRLSRAAAAVAVASLGVSLGCKIEPEPPELRFNLNPKFSDDPAFDEYLGDPTAQDQLRGALEMLFGTPSNPGFFLTEELLDDDFNPNSGVDDLTEAELEAMLADNGRRFAKAIAHVEAGEFDDVDLPREAIDLRRWWKDDMAAIEEARADEESDVDALIAEIQERWVYDLQNYYPTLRESAEMYRQQCLHCHGVEGGGDGPTADFLNPRPRDYRRGIFKFTALRDKARPRRQDVFRILSEGVYTTSMPSFRRFSDAQLHGLVDYVRLLSIRGRVEELAAVDYDYDEGGITLDGVIENYESEWDKWRSADDYVITYDGEVPPASQEMIARGRELFNDEATANCASCHGIDGRGNGPSAKEQDPETQEMVPIKDDWGEEIAPRDLTRGVYRFGRRPIDIYRRVHAGINGTPMPAQTTLTDPSGNRLLSDEDFWAIVHYVRFLGSHENGAGEGGH